MHQPMIPRKNILSLDVHSTHNHDLALKWTRVLTSGPRTSFEAMLPARPYMHASTALFSATAHPHTAWQRALPDEYVLGERKMID